MIISTMLFVSVLRYRDRLQYFVMSGIMCLLLALKTNGADYAAYESLYSRMNSLSAIMEVDPGFTFLMYLVKKIGLPYSGFLVIVAITGMTVLSISLLKFSKQPALILVIYFLTFWSGHMIQIRAFVSELIILYVALDYVYGGKEKKIERRRIALLLIACLFHGSSLFYLIIPIAMKIRNKWWLIGCVIAFGIMIPSIFRLVMILPFPDYLKIRLGLYTAVGSNFNRSSFVFVIISIFIWCFIDYTTKKLRRRGEEGIDEYLPFVHMRRIGAVGLLACVLIVLYNNNFFRMNRVILLAEMIVIINYYFPKVFARHRENLAVAGILCIGLFWASELTSDPLVSILGNNYLIEMVKGK